MNHRIILSAVGAVLCLVTFCAEAIGYSGGTGDPNDPFQIATTADWQQLMTTSVHWSKSFILTTDLDLTGIALTPIAKDTDSNKTEFQGIPFTGIFDGQGRTIGNAVIQGYNDYVGLFGYIGSGGRIINLRLVNSEIQGRKYVGGLAGFLYWNGTITSCSVDGRTTGTDWCVGGMVGYNWSVVTSCYSSGVVDGNKSVGGLVGINGESMGNIPSGMIISCYSTSWVYGNDNVGGLIGINDWGKVNDSYASGMVQGNYPAIEGGLCATNRGEINRCFWDIQTGGIPFSDGGKGLTTVQMKTLLIFQQYGWIGKGWVMEDGMDYPRLAWEGTGYPAIPEPGPIPLAGSGTEMDPYQIQTVEEFASLCWYVMQFDKHFRLMSDLDLLDIELSPIGESRYPFTGVFDGNGHLIQNAVIDPYGPEKPGIFGLVGSSGRIVNLDLENIIIVGNLHGGGLVGLNQGTIDRCSVSGETQEGYADSSKVGGLVGLNDHGTISRCYANYTAGEIDALYGGLVGTNIGGVIDSCFAVATISGTRGGGLVGMNDNGVLRSCCAFSQILAGGGGLVGRSINGTITDCYALGEVQCTGGGLVGISENSTISDCYAIVNVNGYYGTGGLIGRMEGGVLRRCYAEGSVSGGNCLGGLCGVSGDYMNSPVTILDCYATGDVKGHEEVGGLVGFHFNGGFISNCHATGAVTGSNDVGGLCGVNGSYPYTECLILNCYATGDVTGEYPSRNIGGLCGANTKGTIVNSHSEGYVRGGAWSWGLGGFCGFNSDTLERCYSYGSVSGENGSRYIGGLCGENYGTIYLSFSAGYVSGMDFVYYLGGLCGYNYISATLDGCYSTARVYGGINSNSLGGLCGYNNNGTIRDCYATGTVRSQDGSSQLGGLCGAGWDDEIRTCFWDIETIGMTTSLGGEGKTTAEMNTLSTFTSAGWDFAGESTNGTADVWRMCADGFDYPRLAWEFARGGDFTCPDGVDVEDLALLAESWLTADPNGVIKGDATGDEKVGWEDFAVLSEHWMMAGRLRVTIQPLGAIIDGAQWRRVGTNAWFNNWDTENGIPVGLQIVEFKSIPGWDTPANQKVTISSSFTTDVLGTYTLRMPEGMVAYWAMEDNADDKIVADSGGGNYNGTAQRKTEKMATEGRIGGALAFNGTTDWIDCGTNTALMPDAWTLCAWVKCTNVTTPMLISFGGNYPSIKLQNTSDGRPRIHLGQSNYRYFAASAWTTLMDGLWHHVAFTVPGKEQMDIERAMMYMDGVEVDGDPAVATGAQAGKSHVYLGANPPTSSQRFGGTMDDLMLFDRVLTVGEIQRIAGK